jgi:hypothetical protein
MTSNFKGDKALVRLMTHDILSYPEPVTVGNGSQAFAMILSKRSHGPGVKNSNGR